MRSKPFTRPVRALLLIPALALLGFFFVIPSFASLYLSLTDQKLVGQASDELSFVGFDNYARIAQDPTVVKSVCVSALLLATALVLQQAIGLLIASSLEGKPPRFRGFIHACVYAGWLMPEVAVAFVFLLLFSVDGVVNAHIAAFGGKTIAWLIDRPLLVIVLAQCWSGTACSLIAFEHALSALPEHLRDSARVDGASEFQFFLFVKTPALAGAIASNCATLALGNLGIFGLVYMITGGGPLYVTTNLPVLVFRNSVSGSDTGYGLALSFLLFCLCAALSAFQTRRTIKDEAW